MGLELKLLEDYDASIQNKSYINSQHISLVDFNFKNVDEGVRFKCGFSRGLSNEQKSELEELMRQVLIKYISNYLTKNYDNEIRTEKNRIIIQKGDEKYLQISFGINKMGERNRDFSSINVSFWPENSEGEDLQEEIYKMLTNTLFAISKTKEKTKLLIGKKETDILGEEHQTFTTYEVIKD